LKPNWLIYKPFSVLDYKRVLNGILKIKDKSIVVAGCVRDVPLDIFKNNMDKCCRLVSKFEHYKIIIIENDSRNPLDLKVKDENITLIQRKYGWPKLGNGRDFRRTFLMSQIRNEYVQLIKDKYSSYDYVMIIDYDIYNWRIDGVLNSFGHNDWDMIGANGVQQVDNKELYYDTFALIEKEYKVYQRGVDKDRYDIGESLVPVLSCFGGIGIYSMPAFLSGNKYDTCSLDGNNSSEQCSLFCNMYKNGYKRVYINPNMIVIR